jgi:hypothetical protein
MCGVLLDTRVCHGSCGRFLCPGCGLFLDDDTCDSDEWLVCHECLEDDDPLLPPTKKKKRDEEEETVHEAIAGMYDPERVEKPYRL